MVENELIPVAGRQHLAAVGDAAAASGDVVASEGEQDGLPFGGAITIGAYAAIVFYQDE